MNRQKPERENKHPSLTFYGVIKWCIYISAYITYPLPESGNYFDGDDDVILVQAFHCRSEYL